MNLHLEEPFDHLLACIYQLLTLQPQKAPGEDSSTAGDAFGFTFSEDQDVCPYADEIFDVVCIVQLFPIRNLVLFFHRLWHSIVQNMTCNLCFDYRRVSYQAGSYLV